MIKKINHIGIAVKDIEKSTELFSKFLNKKSVKTEVVEGEMVKTSFFQVGESYLELIMATDPNSTIAKYLEKNKESIHHVAFDVDDIEQEIKRLKNEGFRIIGDNIRDGANNKRVAFLHPKDTNGVLIELCEKNIL